MSTHLLGIVIGGVIPALLFSFNGILNKLSVQSGITTGTLLLLTGIGVALSSIPFFVLGPAAVINVRGSMISLLMGITWGIGVGCVALAISVYKTPLSTVVPLYNMNTLFVVLFSLWIFAEWKHVELLKLIVGAVLVVIGGTLVALA